MSTFIKSKTSIKSYIMTLYLALLPVMILSASVSKQGFLKLLFVVLYSFAFGYLIQKLDNKTTKKQVAYQNSFYPIYLLVSNIVLDSVSLFSVLIQLVVLIVCVLCKLRINIMSLLMLVNLVLAKLLNIVYLNELVPLIILFTSYVILRTNIAYKENIALYSYMFFVFLSLIYGIMINDVSLILNRALNGLNLITIIFILTDVKSSPINKTDIFRYACSYAVLAFLFNVCFNIAIGGVLAALLISIIFNAKKKVILPFYAKKC